MEEQGTGTRQTIRPRRSPREVIFRRSRGTAPAPMLLFPLLASSWARRLSRYATAQQQATTVLLRSQAQAAERVPASSRMAVRRVPARVAIPSRRGRLDSPGSPTTVCATSPMFRSSPRSLRRLLRSPGATRALCRCLGWRLSLRLRGRLSRDAKFLFARWLLRVCPLPDGRGSVPNRDLQGEDRRRIYTSPDF